MSQKAAQNNYPSSFSSHYDNFVSLLLRFIKQPGSNSYSDTVSHLSLVTITDTTLFRQEYSSLYYWVHSTVALKSALRLSLSKQWLHTRIPYTLFIVFQNSFSRHRVHDKTSVCFALYDNHVLFTFIKGQTNLKPSLSCCYI